MIKTKMAKRLKSNQMSDTFTNAIFLTLSGGFQDAYTYLCRGKVFANAQTGNIVLMSTHFLRRIRVNITLSYTGNFFYIRDMRCRNTAYFL